jgi:hypothetical protein
VPHPCTSSSRHNHTLIFTHNWHPGAWVRTTVGFLIAWYPLRLLFCVAYYSSPTASDCTHGLARLEAASHDDNIYGQSSMMAFNFFRSLAIWRVMIKFMRIPKITPAQPCTNGVRYSNHPQRSISIFIILQLLTELTE